MMQPPAPQQPVAPGPQQPVATQPISAQPVAPQPQWGPPPTPPVAPQQTSASPLPSWDAANPNSGPGYWPADPTSAPPQSGPPAWAVDPFDEQRPPAAPRFPATAKPKRGRAGIIAALIVLPLAFGAGGFFLGKSQGDGGSPAAAGTAAKPAASTSLPPYEASQLAINRAKLGNDLSGIAGPWVAEVGGCASNTEPGGPKLPVDEKTHVFCRYGGVSVHFASYRTAAQRDAARAWRQQLSLQNGSLVQGMELPSHKTGGVTGTTGTYVEYALKGADNRAYCGIWWDREGEISAVYLEALCKEDLGGSWAPLRDLWSRHS
ncbi:hypothetical protein FHX34_1021094 [Actinoplanes teichomyceticus]|uniref:Uncharacterized protein n=2 Tax=Actinoplanes teichomyceticus TaxID=1867 RepID=A0A561WKZ6_ACTTI|nr:hypothetical protein FHX34_1021094 [Actinoplanes teichomyceticus]GIF16831.1 hypothetical protein Ate01nite_68630 [Actinoplanes teichomyceticus]